MAAEVKAAKGSGYDRDSIRTHLFSGAPQFRSTEVDLNGVPAEVRQPSIRIRRELFNKCTDEKGNIDANDFLVWSILKNTFVPGTNQRLFDDADYDQLMNMPTGSWVDELIEAMSGLTNPESSGKGSSSSDEAPNDG